MKFVIKDNPAAAVALKATKELCHYIDTRTTNDPNSIEMFKGNNRWYEQGINHGINSENQIFRHMPEYLWVAEVYAIEELEPFIEAGCEIGIKNWFKYVEGYLTLDIRP